MYSLGHALYLAPGLAPLTTDISLDVSPFARYPALRCLIFDLESGTAAAHADPCTGDMRLQAFGAFQNVDSCEQSLIPHCPLFPRLETVASKSVNVSCYRSL